MSSVLMKNSLISTFLTCFWILKTFPGVHVFQTAIYQTDMLIKCKTDINHIIFIKRFREVMLATRWLWNASGICTWSQKLNAHVSFIYSDDKTKLKCIEKHKTSTGKGIVQPKKKKGHYLLTFLFIHNF